jgi:hypothetical protein
VTHPRLSRLAFLREKHKHNRAKANCAHDPDHVHVCQNDGLLLHASVNPGVGLLHGLRGSGAGLRGACDRVQHLLQTRIVLKRVPRDVGLMHLLPPRQQRRDGRDPMLPPMFRIRLIMEET